MVGAKAAFCVGDLPTRGDVLKASVTHLCAALPFHSLLSLSLAERLHKPPEWLPADLAQPDVIGPYRLRKTIGQGAFAKVRPDVTDSFHRPFSFLILMTLTTRLPLALQRRLGQAGHS